MGRHSKKTDSHIRRNSVIALTGLIPIGLVTAANTAGAAPKVPFFNTSSAETVDTAAQATQEPQAQILPAVEAIAEPAPAPAPEPAPLAPVQATPRSPPPWPRAHSESRA
ncbi:hypothetical protein GCM10020255_096250 [Rhodococcus baikonurensis]